MRRILVLVLLSFAMSADLRAADPSTSLTNILAAAQGMGGVCVQLGCGDGAVSARLAGRGNLFVHALEADASQVKIARENLRVLGLYGPVTVEHWTLAWLPYADNLVNVVVAEQPGEIPDAEIVRVLAPNGVAWIQRDGQWSTVRKPLPKEFDEWTHWRHGADGNMVSQDRAVGLPEGLRWVAGPAQDAGGKKWYYDHVLVSASGRNIYMNEEGLTARDSYNGALLWTRPLKATTFKEIGTDLPEFLKLPKMQLGPRTSKVKPVAVGNRLYVAAEGKLTALDAATGEAVAEFGALDNPREIFYEGQTLVVCESNAVRAFDAKTRAALWQVSLQAERVVAGDGSVCCLASNVVLSLDLLSGKELWRIADAAAAPAVTCTYHQGVLVLEKSSWRDDPEGCGVLAYAGKDGRLLWKKDYRPDQTHYKEARAWFADGLLWLQMQTNRVTGFDPQTGRQEVSWISRGKHCATPVATDRFFIAPECEFTDLASGSRSRARMFKSACRLPFIPANGLLYTFPVQCECFPMLRGYMGLSSGLPPSESAERPRLEKGPAFGRIAAVSGGADTGADWPMYRHDVWRSGSTPSALHGAALKPLWSVQVAQTPRTRVAADWKDNPFLSGPITQASSAAGLLFVAVPDEHRLVALDAQNGIQRWSYTAGGRIDTPPTIHEGRCLFGGHDGWVYCLRATDGELAWRFRAAPQEARIMAYGQMESLWPVPGSVLVDQGVAYLAAGRHPMCDGGLRVLALNTRNGELLWEKTVDDLTMTNWYSPMLPNKKKVGLDFEPIDMLVKDGDTVAMSRWQFNPKNGDFRLHLANIEYQTPGLAVPRGLWSYGIRQNKSVEPKLSAVFDNSKLHSAATNEVALLLAGGTRIAADTNGVLRVGPLSLQLAVPPIHDGLIAAAGRLYAVTRDGRIVCFE